MTPAGPEHAAALAAIHAAAFPDDPWDAASFAALLQQPGVAGFIDPRGGLVLLRCVADEAEILSIGAAEKRQGIGTALMRAATAHAETQNACVLHLEVAAANLVLLRCVADEAEILSIGAAEKRQGIGTALMRAATAHAETQNACVLHLEVAAANLPARSLYAALGFEQAGRRTNYYSDGDALILSLPLLRQEAPDPPA